MFISLYSYIVEASDLRNDLGESDTILWRESPASNVDYFENLENQSTDGNNIRISQRAISVPSPVISTWNGSARPTVQFGQPGVSQKWANILGNVSSDIDLSSLTYALNGGSETSLSFHPRRRLEKLGILILKLTITN